MLGSVTPSLILIYLTPEKDKDPPLMTLLGDIIMRSLAQRMRRDLKSGF